MMDEIQQQREDWKKKAMEVGKNIVAPRASEIDETGEFSWDIVDAFHRQGLLSLIIPKEFGGQEADITSFCLIAEEIARYCASSSLLVIVQAVGTMPIVLGGVEDLKENFLKRIVEEGRLVCFCLTEPETGSDAASIRTKAVLKDDYYVLKGTKCFITNGGVADFYTLFATTNPGKKMEGITGFVVEKGTPGLSIGKTEDKMGIRGSNTAEVILNDVKIPISQRIGDEGVGWWLMMRTMNRSRPAIAAQAVGIAQGALDYVIKYVRERDWVEMGDKTLEGQLGEMAIEIEAARALVYKSAAMMDKNIKGIPVQMFSAMAKYLASDIAMKVSTNAVQMLQWEGLLRRHPVERMMRDAKVTQIFEGTNQIQRMVVAHTLLKGK
jgi:alkylation response protein AidB-like acyl-CoA dehydrogenase